jgi:hypothetical protein
MTVPEAPVDEEADPVTREHQTRSPRKVPSLQTETQASAMQAAAQLQLGAGILAPHPAHVVASLLRRQDINHYRPTFFVPLRLAAVARGFFADGSAATRVLRFCTGFAGASGTGAAAAGRLRFRSTLVIDSSMTFRAGARASGRQASAWSKKSSSPISETRRSLSIRTLTVEESARLAR